jgi:hypothetical protein
VTPGTRRRAPWLRRRTATGLALGALLAVAGLGTLLVLWVGLLTSTLRTGLADDATGDPAGACVAAATDGTADAEVSSSLLPPRAVCTWTVDGRSTTTVLAERSAPLATSAAVVTGLGVLTVAAAAAPAVVTAARARRAAGRPADRSGAA